MFDLLGQDKEIQDILKQAAAGNHNIFAGGLADCFKGILYSFLASKIKKDIFLITSSEDMYSIYSEMDSLKKEFGIKKNVLFYPADDSLLYRNIQASKEISKERAAAYKEIFVSGSKVIVTDINAIAEKIPCPENTIKYFMSFEIGKKIRIEDMNLMLAENNYTKTLKVEEVFEYSIRGDIIDIFSPDCEYPLRISVLDDEIESIRFFSLDTYSTTKQLDKIEISLYNPGNKEHEKESSILDYFEAKDTLVVIDDVDKVKNEISAKISKIEKYLHIEETKENIFSLKNIFKKLSGFQKLRTFSIAKQTKGIKFRIKINPLFRRNLDSFFGYLAEMKMKCYAVYIISDNEAESEHIKEIIRNHGNEKDISTHSVKFITADVYRGCVLPDIKLCLISNREIFERYSGKPTRKIKSRFLKPVKHYTELKEGDYVVHSEHGIGSFQGIKTLTVEEITGDFIYIKYAGDDRLYLPIYKINLIDKYIGSDKVPALSSFGSPVWRRTKEEIYREMRAMAEELLRIYAKRQVTGGIKYPGDDEEQRIFENAFIYDETPDQAKAIDDVKHDMEKPKQMDRLVCGDAGFGKTEVAMRAAFKAANMGRQTLVLTSTTLLAQQHMTVFRERMADYPVKVEMISRLVQAKKRKEIVSELKQGRVDILIGTHAVLASDIELPNIGLVIIDEEQHFGVKNKESLRKKYPEADILTLTATPIPRTLYFSLSGIRDISTINTPPVGKRPIETYIVDERLATSKEIILREVLRHGQVYYVHNNIRNIYKVKETLEQNLPEVRFRAAHGRMPKPELEKMMSDFLARKFDVLITTTIIEAGLDMPDVNTIIVSGAENFGLSQLYQLRGRVGRRDRQAYAYLMVRDSRSLTSMAKERLKTIESYVDPGAGFRIAMKDLELRGAGSILGIKQHGNMEKIGFELYCRMLEEAVAKIKGEEIENEVDTKIKVNFKAFIPEDYIWDSAEKLRIYKRLFIAREINDIKKIGTDLSDIWGEYPDEVRNILFVGKLKTLGRKLKLSEISEREGKFILAWDDATAVQQAKFQKFANKYRPHVKFSGSKLEIEFKDEKQFMEMAEELL